MIRRGSSREAARRKGWELATVTYVTIAAAAAVLLAL